MESDPPFQIYPTIEMIVHEGLVLHRFADHNMRSEVDSKKSTPVNCYRRPVTPDSGPHPVVTIQDGGSSHFIVRLCNRGLSLSSFREIQVLIGI